MHTIVVRLALTSAAAYPHSEPLVPISIDLDGAVAVVTGGARGIGAATCELLVQAGARVVIADIDVAAAEVTASALGGDMAMAVATDVTQLPSVTAVVTAAERRFGPVTVLVNNAFATTVGPLLSLSDAQLRQTLDVILLGSLFSCRAVLPGFVERNGGTIINVVSDAGRVGEPNMVAYSAAKAGLLGLTRSLAKEFGPSGITVNAVSPGATRTQTTLEALDRAGISEQRAARAYPLGHLGEPVDVAHAVLWLASPFARWVTGQVLSVNGGYAMV